MRIELGRRRFLQLGGLLLLGRLRALPAAAAPAAGLRVLAAGDAAILAAIGARMTRTGDPAMPAFADTDALRTIDTALRVLPPDVPAQLSWALWLFEWGPPLFVGQPARFTRLPPDWQDAYLAGWAESRFHTRRIAFQAVKNLTMLGYYAQDATWPGIHYGGPWAPRPRRLPA
jgi:hypothetical protein